MYYAICYLSTINQSLIKINVSLKTCQLITLLEQHWTHYLFTYSYLFVFICFVDNLFLCVDNLFEQPCYV